MVCAIFATVRPPGAARADLERPRCVGARCVRGGLAARAVHIFNFFGSASVCVHARARVAPFGRSEAVSGEKFRPTVFIVKLIRSSTQGYW